MVELRKKLEDLRQQLPLGLKEFVASVKLPEDENCFEFSYFKTFINLINLFQKDNIELIIHKEKTTTHYTEMMNQEISLSNPENKNDVFDVKIKILTNGTADHRFAMMSYDGAIFFIEPKDASLLKIPLMF